MEFYTFLESPMTLTMGLYLELSKQICELRQAASVPLGAGCLSLLSHAVSCQGSEGTGPPVPATPHPRH